MGKKILLTYVTNNIKSNGNIDGKIQHKNIHTTFIGKITGLTYLYLKTYSLKIFILYIDLTFTLTEKNKFKIEFKTSDTDIRR